MRQRTNRLMWGATAVVLGVAVAAPGLAQSPPDAIANSLASDPAIPAATAGRVSADGMVFAVAGDRVLDGSTPVTAEELWHVGSLTKSMTATLAARLVEADMITWDSTVAEVLGATYPDRHPAWDVVPLRDFLTHASGMAPNIGRIRAMMLGQGPRGTYVEEMLGQEPVGPRGEYLYSNAGYVVAGAMLEVVGGASWEELIAAEVFAPLGITSAGFGPPQGDVAEGHSARLFGGIRAAGQGSDADNIPAMGPAGRVHLTTEDMLRYLRAHLDRDAGFLSPATWDELHSPVGPQSYAMGWGVGDDGSLVHSGSNTLWYAVAYIDPAAGEAIFVAVNSGDLAEVAESVDSALRDLLTAPPER